MRKRISYVRKLSPPSIPSPDGNSAPSTPAEARSRHGAGIDSGKALLRWPNSLEQSLRGATSKHRAIIPSAKFQLAIKSFLFTFAFEGPTEKKNMKNADDVITKMIRV